MRWTLGNLKDDDNHDRCTGKAMSPAERKLSGVQLGGVDFSGELGLLPTLNSRLRLLIPQQRIHLPTQPSASRSTRACRFPSRASTSSMPSSSRVRSNPRSSSASAAVATRRMRRRGRDEA